MKRITLFMVTGIFAMSSLKAVADSRTILVLDGSGSMWGQIESAHKIEIARDVIRKVLTEVPDDQQLGLVAYGHNRKGDCGDIESLVPVGTDHQQILSAVDRINPKGKTPLSDAVVFAATQLRYQEEPATVILISDGIETCNADPCEVGRSLEAAGVDFTAHVIGFDVVEPEAQAQLSCLAQNTGGRYLSAANATELVEALQETVVEAAVAEASNAQVSEPGLIQLKATELKDGLEIESGLNWKITNAGGDNIVFESTNDGRTEARLSAGVYDVFVTRSNSTKAAPQASAQAGEQLRVELTTHSTISVTIALPLEVTASVRTVPEDATPVNSDIVVYWEGPDRPGDYVTIVKAGSDEGDYQHYKQTSSGQPLTLRVPAEAGDYEVRYVLGKPPTTLASVELLAVESLAQLDAPLSVSAGSTFEVSWQGPAQDNDWITIVKPDAKDSAYKSYKSPKSSVVKLKASLEPGDYEIRYVMAGEQVIARRSIIVTSVTATLTAVDTGAAGDEFQVQWTGPGLQGDWITIVKPDAKDTAYTSYFSPKASASRSGILRLPLKPGDYEVRYVQGGKKVLARRPITVSAATANVTAAEQVTAGSLMQVEWTGPDTEADYVAIVMAGSPDKSAAIKYFYTKQGNPGSLYAPVEPGEYEIRYLQKGKKVLARNNLIVTDTTATLAAPDSAGIGESISVTAQGPNSKNDLISLVRADAADKAADRYFYTKRSMTGSLDMPLEPGTYELRYVLNGKRVIARKSIEATPVTAILDTPNNVVADQPFSVQWTGPAGQRDLIVLAKPEQKESKFITYHYAKRGSPATLDAPKIPGQYEIRYLLSGKKAIHKQTINVVADE